MSDAATKANNSLNLEYAGVCMALVAAIVTSAPAQRYFSDGEDHRDRVKLAMSICDGMNSAGLERWQSCMDRLVPEDKIQPPVGYVASAELTEMVQEHQ